MSLYPLKFHPIFKERVWGGRKLEELYHKRLPPAVPIGESWEMSDLLGDAMFLPSGRVHALGGGLVIFEIQQNSDTTYRVFDWNRVGLDGNPRPLHIKESLECIDFEDFEPALVSPKTLPGGPLRIRALV